jgi:hypothetical protein
MGQRLEKLKTHFRENKTTYISCGITAVVVGAGALFLTQRQQTALVDNKFAYRPRTDVRQTTVNMVERSTPSKPVHLVGTNLYFNSLSEAARETGHPLSTISKHINGHIPDVKGDVFEILEPAS